MKSSLISLFLIISQFAYSDELIKTDKIKLVLLEKENTGKLVEVKKMNDFYYIFPIGVKLKLKNVTKIVIIDGNEKDKECKGYLSQFSHQVLEFTPAINTNLITLMVNAPCVIGKKRESTIKVLVKTVDNKTYYNTLTFKSIYDIQNSTRIRICKH